MRFVIALGVCCVLTGCDPAVTRGLVVSPPPVAPPDSTQLRAVALAARLAERRGIPEADPRALFDWEPGFTWCVRAARELRYLIFCANPTGSGGQFLINQFRTSRLTPEAADLWHELGDSLRAEFGEEWVRECEWRTERESTRVVCVPLVRPDSTRVPGR